MFVTVWVGILDYKTGELKYVSAGHNPPVLMRDNRSDYLRCKNGFVLAGMEDMVYKENTYQLEDGDLLYLYTDGVTEAENTKKELLGFDHLLELLQTAQQPIDDQTIYDLVCRFSAGAEQSDDIAIMNITRK
jgi:sigma-B regulation protein RsbU (phosphoserine phosphatase)